MLRRLTRVSAWDTTTNYSVAPWAYGGVPLESLVLDWCSHLATSDALRHGKGFIQICMGVVTESKRTSEQSSLGFVLLVEHSATTVLLTGCSVFTLWELRWRSHGLHGTSQLSIPTQTMLTKPCLWGSDYSLLQPDVASNTFFFLHWNKGNFVRNAKNKLLLDTPIYAY